MEQIIKKLLHMGWPIDTICSYLDIPKTKKKIVLKIAKDLQILANGENKLLPRFPWDGKRHQNGLKHNFDNLYS